VRVPSEQMSPSVAFGFRVLGFDVPFVAFGAFAGVLPSLLFYVALLLVIAVFSIVRGGGLKASARWWRHARVAFVNGMITGSFFALVMVSLFSCGASLGRTGYGMFRG
jgi:hypothetical protein